jgi:hypothetical protein
MVLVIVRVLTNQPREVNRVREQMRTAASAFTLIFSLATACLFAQNEPILVPDVVDYNKLIPILPDAPSGWTADKPEGLTNDVAGFKISNVHRDYRKGDAVDAPTASISILDSVANPDYVEATTNAWTQTSETPDGYSKPATIDGNPGFEAYEKRTKTRVAVGNGGEALLCRNRTAKSGPKGTSGMDQAHRPEEAGGD